jgi:hypothetical protein
LQAAELCAKPGVFFAGGAGCVRNAPLMRRVQLKKFLFSAKINDAEDALHHQKIL